MDIKDERIPGPGFVVRRELEEGIDLLAANIRGVVRRLDLHVERHGEVKLRPELPVDVGEAGLGLVGCDSEEVADEGWDWR